ncbi:MAG: carbamoyl phosphate synthase small subunit, partial [Planctomycetota bacterium]|nr:carbamoyl phosphate synthase small subunit [Planctomycetota bacterium]
MSRTAKLALSDGTVFTGTGFGADGEVFGEVVFNTSMTGYQEILTDPSYCGQIVAMTYPQIGNYGVNAEDVESGGIACRGFIIRELCELPSNFRSVKSLDAYLSEHGVIGLEGIDTRALVRRLRVRGVMTGVISTTDLDDASLIEKAKRSPDLVGIDYVKEVMPQTRSEWADPLPELGRAFGGSAATGDASKTDRHVVAVDYGMKWN